MVGGGMPVPGSCSVSQSDMAVMEAPVNDLGEVSTGNRARLW